MSHSGIPLVSNIAADLATVTGAQDVPVVGWNGKVQDEVVPIDKSPFGTLTQPAPAAPPATPTPSDPSVTKAETDEDQKHALGQSANILTSGAGLLTQPYTSRATLLGN